MNNESNLYISLKTFLGSKNAEAIFFFLLEPLISITKSMMAFRLRCLCILFLSSVNQTAATEKSV